MSTFEKELEIKSETEIEALVKDFSEKIDFTTEEVLDPESIKEMFNYRTAVNALGDLVTAAEIQLAIRPHIDRLIESGNEPVESRELFADWVFNELNIIEEAKDTFVAMPYYQAIFDHFAALPEGIYTKLLKTGLQMGHHFKYWIAMGGVLEELSPEGKEFLEDVTDNWAGKVEDAIESLKNEGEWDKVVDLQKAMYRYYQHGKRPNEAISYLKRVIEDTPKTEDYHEADVADLLMDLGKIFAGHRKWQAAIKYFGQAMEIYEAQGEEFELFTMQAEGWIKEAEKMSS